MLIYIISYEKKFFFQIIKFLFIYFEKYYLKLINYNNIQTLQNSFYLFNIFMNFFRAINNNLYLIIIIF